MARRRASMLGVLCTARFLLCTGAVECYLQAALIYTDMVRVASNAFPTTQVDVFSSFSLRGGSQWLHDTTTT